MKTHGRRYPRVLGSSDFGKVWANVTDVYAFEPPVAGGYLKAQYHHRTQISCAAVPHFSLTGLQWINPFLIGFLRPEYCPFDPQTFLLLGFIRILI